MRPLLCTGYVTYVKQQNQLHAPRQILMLQLDSMIHCSSTDMLTSERYIEILDLLESLDRSLIAGRQALSSLSALLAKTCTLEQLAKLMVYSFPYWCGAAPCELSHKEVEGVSIGRGTCYLFRLRCIWNHLQCSWTLVPGRGLQ